LADQYQVRVSMNAGPFAAAEPQTTVIRKSDLSGPKGVVRPE